MDMKDQEQVIKRLAQIITFYGQADLDQMLRVGESIVNAKDRKNKIEQMRINEQ
jgi:hypothetical protein